MHLLSFLLFLISVPLFAQEQQTASAQLQIADHCKQLVADPYQYDINQQTQAAKECQQFYTTQLKTAVTLINKQEKTACDYLNLKKDVSNFNYILEKEIRAVVPELKDRETMKDYYDVMYADENLRDCAGAAYADILLQKFQLENSKIMDDNLT